LDLTTCKKVPTNDSNEAKITRCFGEYKRLENGNTVIHIAHITQTGNEFAVDRWIVEEVSKTSPLSSERSILNKCK
jgi:hypothetical protein